MTDLIERLEAATEGGRELDEDIFVQVACGGDYSSTKFAAAAQKRRSGWEPHAIPHYTTSLDAKLPGENIVRVQYNYGSCLWEAFHNDGDEFQQIGYGNTEALARRGAGLRALRARQSETAPDAKKPATP